MDASDMARLLELQAQMFSCGARVLGMQAGNAQKPQDQPYSPEDFSRESAALLEIADALHNWC